MISVDQGSISLNGQGLSCRFDFTTGRLIAIESDDVALSCDGLFVDVGVDGEFALRRFEYQSFEPFHTWELPQIVPIKEATREWKFEGYEQREDSLVITYSAAGLRIMLTYSIEQRALTMNVNVVNDHSERRLLNGIAFHLIVNDLQDAVTFFPGNVPHQPFAVSELTPYVPVQTGLSNPIVTTSSGDTRFHVLFIDQEEKWGTGVYKNDSGGMNYVQIAGVESYLEPGASLECGTHRIMPVDKDSDLFEPVKSLYRAKGWTAPTDGITEGVLYSCHPHGTMDSGFPWRLTMREYAEKLTELRDIGVDHLWVLPIFEHLDRGVYHPTDQSIIDERYGTDADVKYFVDQAHEHGMTVLFDYVPHGPELEDEFGKNHLHWASVDREGKPKIEWNCLSFDMTNPEYLQYTKELVKGHVARFGVDGSRIDCAMGGLSNWNALPGHRPSSSGLKGGFNISKAIRDAFVEAGKQPLVTPENFHPVPFYAPITDIFYDFPLYRTFVEMEQANVSPAEYVKRLTRWLEAERASSPDGQLKLRFLGNHDTVTWVWQKARATAVYGIEKAKALWVLMSTIDGIVMIYQGDEDGTIYGHDGPDLRAFFKALFQARHTWLGNKYDIEYAYTNNSIIAFTRRNEGEERLIAVNLGDQPAQWTADRAPEALLYGEGAEISGQTIKLAPYGYAIFNL